MHSCSWIFAGGVKIKRAVSFRLSQELLEPLCWTLRSTGFLVVIHSVRRFVSLVQVICIPPAWKGRSVTGEECTDGLYPACSLGELKLKREGIKSWDLQTLRWAHSRLRQGKFWLNIRKKVFPMRGVQCCSGARRDGELLPLEVLGVWLDTDRPALALPWAEVWSRDLRRSLRTWITPWLRNGGV